ncbi:MAG: hypothetical protein KJ795_00005 [Gammaproteobacteria bacterium]|nr:hypothetical protein [Gammaproteobacteria bacterium]
MEWILLAVVLGYIFYQFRAGFISEVSKPKFTVSITKTDDSEEDARRDAEKKKIREEISAEVAKHADAVRLLQAIARIDGQTSDAERRIVFSFLVRHGAQLTEDRHWPYFAHYSGGEFSRAIELDEIGMFVTALSSKELPYRIDVFSSVQAIVATGGVPKKREGEALVMAERLIKS